MINPLAVIFQQVRLWVLHEPQSVPNPESEAHVGSAVEVAGGWLYLLPAAAIFLGVCAFGLWIFSAKRPESPRTSSPSPPADRRGPAAPLQPAAARAGRRHRGGSAASPPRQPGAALADRVFAAGETAQPQRHFGAGGGFDPGNARGERDLWLLPGGRTVQPVARVLKAPGSGHVESGRALASTMSAWRRPTGGAASSSAVV